MQPPPRRFNVFFISIAAGKPAAEGAGGGRGGAGAEERVDHQVAAVAVFFN